MVHVRATVFLQHPFFSPWAAESIARDGTIRLPFGGGRTSPVDTRDVAEVIATILEDPGRPCRQGLRVDRAALGGHEGRRGGVLRGPRPDHHVCRRAVRSVAAGAPARGLPEHLLGHLLTMAKLHADNRYDRLTHDVEAVTGRPATSVRDYVAKHPEMFGSSKPARVIP